MWWRLLTSHLTAGRRFGVAGPLPPGARCQYSARFVSIRCAALPRVDVAKCECAALAPSRHSTQSPSRAPPRPVCSQASDQLSSRLESARARAGWICERRVRPLEKLIAVTLTPMRTIGRPPRAPGLPLGRRAFSEAGARPSRAPSLRNPSSRHWRPCGTRDESARAVWICKGRVRRLRKLFAATPTHLAAGHGSCAAGTLPDWCVLSDFDARPSAIGDSRDARAKVDILRTLRVLTAVSPAAPSGSAATCKTLVSRRICDTSEHMCVPLIAC